MQRSLKTVTLFLLVHATLIQAEEKNNQNDRAKVNESDPQLKAELKEIDGIRDRLGIDLYKGTLFEDGAAGASQATQFLEIYRKLAKKHRTHVAQAVYDRVDEPSQAPRQVSSDFELFQSLVEAGRQLDLAAAGRESVGSLEEANRLRKLSKKIRKLLPDIKPGASVRAAKRQSD